MTNSPGKNITFGHKVFYDWYRPLYIVKLCETKPSMGRSRAPSALNRDNLIISIKGRVRRDPALTKLLDHFSDSVFKCLCFEMKYNASMYNISKCNINAA